MITLEKVNQFALFFFTVKMKKRICR